MRHDELHLWYVADPTEPRCIGRLRLVESGRGVSLRYAKGWIDRGFALSEDLPLVDVEYLPLGRLSADAPRAVGAVDDARPDRWGERVIRYIDKPDRLSLMEFLYYAGDDRFGALGVSTSASDYLPRPGGPLPRRDQAQQISEIVAKVEDSAPISAIEQQMLAAGGTLGGAQPKALIEIDGVEWVIKFRRKDDPLDSQLIEHATMTLSARAGIRAAETQVVALAKGNAIAIRRFDRDGQRRIHSISAGTALRAATPAGQEPDLSYPALARLLRRTGVVADDANRRDARELFRRMVFNILMDNTDDHEKNHALLAADPDQHGRYRLSPAYDVLPSAGAHGYQEFACGDLGQESSLANAMSRCQDFGLRPLEAAQEVSRVIEVVEGWREHFRECGVSADDIEMVGRHVDGDALKRHREVFSADDYAIPAPKKRARGPFG
jgi:serine/threonine-protein kinase HipA